MRRQMDFCIAPRLSILEAFSCRPFSLVLSATGYRGGRWLKRTGGRRRIRLKWLIQRTIRIQPNHWSVIHIQIEVDAGADADRIAAEPFSQPRRVIPRTMKLQSTLFISLFPCVSVSLWSFCLAAYHLKRSASVRCVF